MLNQAWTFWMIGDIAFYAAIGFAVAAALALAAFIFEIISAVRQGQQTKAANVTPISAKAAA
jgi:hypothetical protein